MFQCKTLMLKKERPKVIDDFEHLCFIVRLVIFQIRFGHLICQWSSILFHNYNVTKKKVKNAFQVRYARKDKGNIRASWSFPAKYNSLLKECSAYRVRLNRKQTVVISGFISYFHFYKIVIVRIFQPPSKHRKHKISGMKHQCSRNIGFNTSMFKTSTIEAWMF